MGSWVLAARSSPPPQARGGCLAAAAQRPDDGGPRPGVQEPARKPHQGRAQVLSYQAGLAVAQSADQQLHAAPRQYVPLPGRELQGRRREMVKERCQELDWVGYQRIQGGRH